MHCGEGVRVGRRRVPEYDHVRDAGRESGHLPQSGAADRECDVRAEPGRREALRFVDTDENRDRRRSSWLRKISAKGGP